MSKADDLLDRVHFASLRLEAWRAKREAGGRIYPADWAAALEEIREARDELQRIGAAGQVTIDAAEADDEP